MKTYLSLKTYPSLLTQRALLPPSATAQQPREQQRRRFHRGGVWRVALRDAAAHGQKLLRARDVGGIEIVRVFVVAHRASARSRRGRRMAAGRDYGNIPRSAATGARTSDLGANPE